MKGSEYIYVDLDEKRLEMAQKLGADIIIQVQREQTAKEVAARVRESLNKAPNKVLECTGAESSINTGIYVSPELCHMTIGSPKRCENEPNASKCQFILSSPHSSHVICRAMI